MIAVEQLHLHQKPWIPSCQPTFPTIQQFMIEEQSLYRLSNRAMP